MFGDDTRLHAAVQPPAKGAIASSDGRVVLGRVNLLAGKGTRASYAVFCRAARQTLDRATEYRWRFFAIKDEMKALCVVLIQKLAGPRKKIIVHLKRERSRVAQPMSVQISEPIRDPHALS